MRAKTLVQAWLEVELDVNHKTLATALREMNKALDAAHTHSRVREWEENRNGRGDRLPRRVRVYMAKKVVDQVLKDAGVDTKKLNKRNLNKIVDQLC